MNSEQLRRQLGPRGWERVFCVRRDEVARQVAESVHMRVCRGELLRLKRAITAQIEEDNDGQ